VPRARGTSGGRRLPWFAVLAGLVLAGALAPAPGAAAMTREEAAIVVQSRYGVEVLRVRAGTIDGRPVWLVTVMKPGADSNDAFQVTTLAVEQETGLLVPAFRHGASGPLQPSEAPRGGKSEQRPTSMRSGTWR
jgi:hypothetical protein